MSGSPVLALDIGGTNTRMGLVYPDGRLASYQSVPSSSWQGSEPLSGLCDLMAAFLSAHAPQEVRAISLGLPGAVSKDRRRVINVPTIPAFDGVPVADMLEARFAMPVFLDRDVVMLYAHAARALDIPASGTTLGFFIGTGIGNLIVLEGRAFVGAGGIAGELGHIPLPGRDAPCGCGQRGCAEQYAAGHALVAIRDRHFPGEPLDQLFTRHLDSPPVQEFVEILAQVMATEIIILNPHRVLLGGGVITMPGFPVDALKGQVTARLRNPAAPLDWFLAPEAQ